MRGANQIGFRLHQEFRVSGLTAVDLSNSAMMFFEMVVLA